MFWMLLLIGITSAQEPPAHVTILYDAFGKASTLRIAVDERFECAGNR